MSFLTKAGMSFTTPAGTISNVLAEYTTDALVEYDITIAPSASNFHVYISWPYANIKAVLISGTAAMTIYTNDTSGGSPDDTISLTSTILAKCWTHNGVAGNIASNPFTADVESIYVTSTAGGTLKIRVAYDATP